MMKTKSIHIAVALWLAATCLPPALSFAQTGWTQKANFGGGAREAAVGFSIGSKGYIGTGLDGAAYKQDFWEYNPALDTIPPTGVSELPAVIDLQSAITIYPNPNTGEFVVRIIPTKYEFVRIYDPIAIGLRIMNILGEVVYQQQTSNNKHQTINLQQQPAGFYFMQVVTSEGVINKRVVVAP